MARDSDHSTLLAHIMAEHEPNTTCPNSWAGGCRCPQHDEGLLATSAAERMTALANALDHQAARTPLTLRVVTMGPPTPDDCDGTMTCTCQRCVQDRVTRPALGAGRAQFQVRPSRAARLAA